jgi:hypothetical protein
VQGFMGTGNGALFQNLMDFLGGDFPTCQFPAKEFVGVAESLEEGGKKGSQGAWVREKKVVKLPPIHGVKPGGFQSAGGGGAGLVIQECHFAEDVSGNEMTEGHIPLAGHVNGDFNPALEDAKRLIAFLALAKDDLSLAKGLFAHIPKRVNLPPTGVKGLLGVVR